ncbi:hypothetical protein CEXT_187221 [Caerostris extrusa]|uniref:Secreted protein n=1 Tax=Caerostris extrusa TaxID=172846 RepID=A0AAV4VSZ5_CAEEX|nr:hypothetical protein CEXT_187221 [Caerostris extrusa]
MLCAALIIQLISILINGHGKNFESNNSGKTGKHLGHFTKYVATPSYNCTGKEVKTKLKPLSYKELPLKRVTPPLMAIIETKERRSQKHVMIS